jgi:hypothetical protein
MASEQRVPELPAWRPVGWTSGPGRPRRVYEALVPLPCRHCGRLIQPGEHFSRRQVQGGSAERRPFCRTCPWFAEEEPRSRGGTTEGKAG